MTKEKLILDCDPGVDDATALLLAFAAPDKIDFLAVTTVAGNVAPGLTARNARLIREIAGREDVPVYAGCEVPMVRPAVEAAEFHGQSGLGDFPVFEPKGPLGEGHAVLRIIEMLMAAPPASVNIAITGPCTNIAMALRLEPKIVRGIKQLIIMGGARAEGGNITPSAEFNIYADPHAAEVVARASCPLVFHSLDSTHQVRCFPDRIAALEKTGTRAALASAAMMRFANSTERGIETIGAAPLHDPCTIAYVLAPDLFVTQPVTVSVDLAGGAAYGATSADLRDAPANSNARWVVKADAPGIFAMITDRLGRA